MPSITGADLAALLTNQSPLLKVLYLSGYAGNMMLEKGLTTPDSPLLDQPFSTTSRLTKARWLLDGERKGN